MNQNLITWMDVLISYAEDWDKTFRGRHSNYFTQEYWYLFTACTRAYLSGNPLTVSQALDKMRAEKSANAKKERIERAIDGVFLTKAEDLHADRRRTCILPTEKLISLLQDHLERTLISAQRAVCARDQD